MGQAIIIAAAAQDDLQIAGLWVRDAARVNDLDIPANILVSDDLVQIAKAADVIIDFSLPEAVDDVVAAATKMGKPLVSGVSGLSEKQVASLDAAARHVAVVYDRNMSLGVAVLEKLVAQAAASLGKGFGIEIHETHHVHKVDSPSGTALKLGEAVAAASGTNAGDIHYEVERRGEVPGDHSVVFSSATECLTLRHSVTTRQVFADGALRAARWVVTRPAGRYSMQDLMID
jgi:4-hydroxy-tetrahydrodipicolinate reductase